MEPNKILSANILDLIFDDRNKEYGAYELRTTYPERITKSLLITATVAALIFGGAVLANTFKPDETARLAIKEVTLTEIALDVKEPEPLPEQKKPEPEPQIRTEKLTVFDVVPDEKADVPPPDKEELQNAQIDVAKHDGIDDIGIANPAKELGKGTGIIEENRVKEPDIWTSVEVDAKFNGNWEKFLIKNLNANVPVDNGAPAGKYNVLIKFVVDLDGNVSDIKALSNNGYGMEQEAIRVLKKATNWEPAIQNGKQVKAYRMQPITFLINEE
jgi:protein TonB